MTIDKLIEKYSKPSIFKLVGTNISIVETGNVKSDLLELKEELMKESVNIEYNHKIVKVPQFIADWIKRAKNDGEWPGIFFDDACVSPEIQEWNSSIKNCEIFMSAWTNDYEVEEEPKYWIKCNDSYLSFVTFSHKSASEIETSPDYLEAILFTFKPQADHMALLVNGTVEEVNHGDN